MPPDNLAIIVDASERRAARRVFLFVLGASLVTGTATALFYANQDLTLSHYDARAHLLVARRVFDSLTPGWRQVGAVWLPLPHLLNMLPTQVDWAYRTGAVGVAISVGSLAWGLSALGVVLFRHTRSTVAAVVPPLVILLNPNVLYLQSTPMTEPLLFGLSLLVVARAGEWVREPSAPSLRRAGWVLFALVWTRYEGWCVAGALLVLAAVGARPSGFWRGWVRLAAYPASAIALFLCLGWASTGAWFVSSGFFTPDNPSFHRPLAAAGEVLAATHVLGGALLMAVGAAGSLVSIVGWRRERTALLPIALLAAGALPFYAFYQGHPHRVRYMVPLVVAFGAMAGMAVRSVPVRWRGPASVVVGALVIALMPPLTRDAPMVQEAQWERPFQRQRQTVTAYLAQFHDGSPILASMGSLGHYMQESSSIGLRLDRYLHEGNGDLWGAAMRSPRRHVGWILIEERAEGGDMLAARAREDETFLEGFARVAEGGGLVLYRRPRR
jgi:hypothetical protein